MCWRIAVPRDETTPALLQLRDVLLETGSWPDQAQLRPEIALSWRRCLFNGVRPDKLADKQAPKVNPDGPLFRAAAGVVVKRSEQLSGTSTGLIVADRAGVVIHRWTDDSRLATQLDASRSEWGWSLDEGVAGTNGVGTVLEDPRPIMIRGAEHFTDAFRAFTCVGVPIRHPITRQVQGVLNLTCRYEDTNNLMLPMALEVAHDIERRLYLGSSRKQRLLLEQFLSTEKRNDRPLIALNEQLVITNPAAARVVDEVGQETLWEHAAHVIGDRQSRITELPLRSGAMLTVRCTPVEDGASVIGAIIDVQPQATPQRRTPRRLASAYSIDGFVGQSAAWRETCDQAWRFRESGLPMLVTGEPGVGKLTLVNALFPEHRGEGRLEVLDAALQPVEGVVNWVTAFREAVRHPDNVVVIRHLEALDDTAAQAVCSVIDTGGSVGARLVATLSKREGASPASSALQDRFSVATITVPPLRDRLDDLPDLLAELTRKHSGEAALSRWRTDAVQTLSRLDWPANVRELDNLVRRVLSSRRGSDISAEDLPEDLRRQATRRRLSHLERIECEAILTAVQRARGNKSEAAALLGISRATLYRKLRSFGVELRSSAF
jgi:transcriptional regulator of acetoin/glycerol metabolism